jgi:hypothetical protein
MEQSGHYPGIDYPDLIIPLKDQRRMDGLYFITEQLLAKKRITAQDLRSNLEISKTKVETAPKQEKTPFPDKVPPAPVSEPRVCQRTQKTRRK